MSIQKWEVTINDANAPLKHAIAKRLPNDTDEAEFPVMEKNGFVYTVKIMADGESAAILAASDYLTNEIYASSVGGIGDQRQKL